MISSTRKSSHFRYIRRGNPSGNTSHQSSHIPSTKATSSHHPTILCDKPLLFIYSSKYHKMKSAHVHNQSCQANMGQSPATSSLFEDTKYYSSPKFIFGQRNPPTTQTVKIPQPSKLFLPIPCTLTRDTMNSAPKSNELAPVNTYHRRQNKNLEANSAHNFRNTNLSLDDPKYYSSPKFIFGQGRDPTKEHTKPAVNTTNPSRFLLPIPYTVRRDDDGCPRQ